jgi:hypothetical protein
MPAGEPFENEDQDLTTEALTRRALLRRGLGFAIAAPAVLTLLQACGDDDDDGGGDGGNDGDAEETEVPAADETEPAAETPAAAETPIDVEATTGGGGAAPTTEPVPDPGQIGS